MEAARDFLSLYTPPAHEDPRPPAQGAFLKTRNFLQHQHIAEDNKPPLNILPGGIGTYSITYFNQATSSSNMNDDKKGQTGEENFVTEAGLNGDWPTSLEQPTQSSSNHMHCTRSFSSPSSSQPSTAHNHSFVNMLTSAKSVQEEDDDDDDEEEFIIKKEPSLHPKGPLPLKAHGRGTDQKPSTPRSKHSATEQRRRSKINDRLQKLREIIPHGDQKRDRASFLLEVIEYIQFLQEKVHKYERTYPGLNQDGPKFTPWRNPGATEDLLNSSHIMKMAMNPALLLPSKLDGKKLSTSPLHPINRQHLVIESDLSSPCIFREKVPQPEPSKRPCINPFGGSNGTTVPLPSQSKFWPREPFSADCNVLDKLRDQELGIESGKISISSIYSQGLFDTLTHALQSSGIDLSQANISVQIDLGKKANGRVDSSASVVKDTGMPLSSQEMPRSSFTRTGEDCSAQQAVKRFKSCRSPGYFVSCNHTHRQRLPSSNNIEKPQFSNSNLGKQLNSKQ